MGLVHFTNSAADGDRSNAANWTDDVPAPLGRVPAAGDAAQMDAESDLGDLTCDSVNTNGYDFRATGAPNTITVGSMSIGKAGSAAETVGGDSAVDLMTITGNVVGADGVIGAQGVFLYRCHINGNVSGYTVPFDSFIDGTLNFPGKVSSTGAAVQCSSNTVSGAATITGLGTIHQNTFQSTVSMTLATGVLADGNTFNGAATITTTGTGHLDTNVFNSTASITVGTTGRLSANTFNGAATLIVTAPSGVITTNTFNNTLSLTVGSLVITVDGSGGGAKGRSQGFW